MLIQDLITHEKDFKEKNNWFYKTQGLAPNSIRLSKNKGNNPKDFWHSSEKTKKERILLHFTAGRLVSDISALTGKPKGTGPTVTVSYVLARDGTIYELFDSDFWGYHLGSMDQLNASAKIKTSNTYQSSSSVAIEISNFGSLKKKGNSLLAWTGAEYCSVNDKTAYTELETPYRGEKYFASYTDQQYASLASLLDFLSSKHNIPLSFLPVEKRYELLKSAPTKGVYSHVNFRADKTDIGPAFDWSKIIK